MFDKLSKEDQVYAEALIAGVAKAGATVAAFWPQIVRASQSQDPIQLQMTVASVIRTAIGDAIVEIESLSPADSQQ